MCPWHVFTINYSGAVRKPVPWCQIWTGHKKILLCNHLLSLSSSAWLSLRAENPSRMLTTHPMQKSDQQSKAKIQSNKQNKMKQNNDNKAKSQKPNPNQSKKQKEMKNRPELYLIASERFLFLCPEGDCSALNASIGKCLWAVLLKCRDQIWPIISSNKATTLVFKLSVLLYPISLSSQNKGMKSY